MNEQVPVKWTSAMDDRLSELVGMRHARTIARVLTNDFGVTVTTGAVHDRWLVVGCGVHAALNPGRWHLADIAREVGASRSAVFHVAKQLNLTRIGRGHYFYVSDEDRQRLFDHYGLGKPRSYSTQEVATLLHFDAHTVAKWCRQGKLPGAWRRGKDWRVPVDAITLRGSFGAVQTVAPEPKAPRARIYSDRSHILCACGKSLLPGRFKHCSKQCCNREARRRRVAAPSRPV